ncbi:HDOD domain-containing protein [Gimesia fumaroli]|uniref:Transcriptional regulatory protein YycF n=1 Tax=Gimesia fumaroli TaxID=2527976 RepID=A0A518IA60_9PLAN|nr:HDOD domain-containing protein [Gimesia fumaroli]QDV50007.1 Transcriptional regulatory protein YycF [Gimesia fumaroli]
MNSTIDIMDFRALVTDDDKIVSRMLSAALTREGFLCNTATDGVHAQALLNQKPYDLVITDLHMPNKNGHSLAIELLEQEFRPVIMVHTAIKDPNLTKDLTFRGVEDVSFKPTDYELLASKARGLAERRREKLEEEGAGSNMSALENKQNTKEMLPVKSNLTNGIRVSPTKVYQSMSQLDSVFPLSHVPFDVYSLASRENAGVDELAQLIVQDELLTAEILNLANSEESITESNETVDLEKAILLLGCQRIGELAIMSGAKLALTSCSAPWINCELLWKRSLAASKTVRIIEKTQFSSSDGSAYLCALFHPVGRIVLATLFPEEHRALTEHCQETGESLDLAEEAAFGLSYGQIAARFFSAWRIPATSRLPLEHLTRTFDEMISLPDPTRQNIEIVKLSLLLSRIAMSLWDPCDTIDIPRRAVLNKLNMPSVQRTLALIQEACDFECLPQPLQPELESDQLLPKIATLIEYVSTASTTSDLLFPLLSSLGLNIHDQQLELAHLNLIDGVSLGNKHLSEFIEDQHLPDYIGIIRHYKDASLFKPGAAICLPTTVQKLFSFFAT